MKRKQAWHWPLVALAAVLLFALARGNQAEDRAERFVTTHGETIVASWQEEGAIPEVGYRYVNEWPGEHDMLEFILAAGTGGYSGCYYSPDGVPLAFQNTAVPLEQTDSGRWSWQGEGDNHGETWRIEGNWFGFQARF